MPRHRVTQFQGLCRRLPTTSRRAPRPRPSPATLFTHPWRPWTIGQADGRPPRAMFKPADRTRPDLMPGRSRRPYDSARTICHDTTEPPRHRAAHRLRLARRLRRAIRHRGRGPHPGVRPRGTRLRRDHRGAGRRAPARRHPHLLGARLLPRRRGFPRSSDRGQARRGPRQHRRGHRHRAGRVGHQRAGLLRRRGLRPRRRHGAGLDAGPGRPRPRGPEGSLGSGRRPAAPVVHADLRHRRLRPDRTRHRPQARRVRLPDPGPRPSSSEGRPRSRAGGPSRAAAPKRRSDPPCTADTRHTTSSAPISWR